MACIAGWGSQCFGRSSVVSPDTGLVSLISSECCYVLRIRMDEGMVGPMTDRTIYLQRALKLGGRLEEFVSVGDYSDRARGIKPWTAIYYGTFGGTEQKGCNTYQKRTKIDSSAI